MDYDWRVSSMDSTIDNCLKQLVWSSLNLFCKLFLFISLYYYYLFFNYWKESLFCILNVEDEFDAFVSTGNFETNYNFRGCS